MNKNIILVSILIVGSRIAIASADTTSRAIENSKFDISSGQTLTIRNLNGLIKLVSGAKENTVNIEKKHFGPTCKFNIEQKPSEVVIAVTKDDFTSDSCAADLKINVDGTPKTSLMAGNGSIAMSGDYGPTTLTLGNGNVSWNGSSQSLSIQSGNGNLSVLFTKINGQTKLQIQSGNGDVDIQLPKQTKIHILSKMGMGTFENKLAVDPSAPVDLQLLYGNGKASVHD